MNYPVALPNFGFSRAGAGALIGAMLLAALLAWWARPTVLLSEQRNGIDLETLVPTRFGDWTALPHTGQQIVNPQQQAVLDKLYTQTVGRTYTDGKGNAVMLSIAYGSKQNDSFALHYPEACYPAQGFQVGRVWKDTLHTGQGGVAVTRLITRMGQRVEPVTYWATVGDFVVQRGLDTKLQQIRYGVRGLVPDGLIFRVSTVSAQVDAGFALQNTFVGQLMDELAPEHRYFMAGL